MPAQMIRIMGPSMRTVGHHRSRPLLISGVLVLALCLTGCGSNLVLVKGTEIRFRLDEFSITPQNVQVHAGKIKFAAVNAGVETHDLVVEPDHLNSAGDPIYLNTPVIAQPGQLIPPFKLNLAPGHYKLVDTVADHVDLGEYGTLTVVK
jgi:hypothetical protein